MPDITLFCWFIGDTPEQVFSINVWESVFVAGIRHAIIKKFRENYTYEENDLVLWQTSVVGDRESLEAEAERLTTTVTPLRPTMRLHNLFTTADDDDEEMIRIIVKKPRYGRGTLVAPTLQQQQRSILGDQNTPGFSPTYLENLKQKDFDDFTFYYQPAFPESHTNYHANRSWRFYLAKPGAGPESCFNWLNSDFKLELMLPDESWVPLSTRFVISNSRIRVTTPSSQGHVTHELIFPLIFSENSNITLL